jgi:hypothetical protein
MHYSLRQISVCVLTGIFLVSPFRASAWVDAANLVQNTISAVNSVQQTFFGNQQWIKEYVLDPAQKAISIGIQDRLKQSILNWARNGFDGQPSFIQNPRDFALNTVMNESNVFTDRLNNIINDVCTPFQADVRIKVALGGIDSAEDIDQTDAGLRRITECKLQEAVTSGVIENYFQPGGFVTEGGLGPILKMSARSSDDPILAPDVVAAQQQRMQQQALEQEKFLSYGGMLPNKYCVQRTPSGGCARYEIKISSSNVSNAVSKVFGHSLEELSGQDELAEAIFSGIVMRLTNELLDNGL